MKLFCLLVAVVAVDAMVGSSYPTHPPPRLTIDDIEDMTEALETNLQSVAGTISDITTLCAVGEDELNEIYDFDIPRLNTENAQQTDLIASYAAQVKALQHRVDAAKALKTEALDLAESTADDVADQIDEYLNGTDIAGVNDRQAGEISSLDMDISTCKSSYLTNITDTIDSLNTMEDSLRNDIDTLNALVADRTCEYGFGAFDSNGTSTVSFQTTFSETPEVSISVAGFQAHLDVYRYHSYNSYDVLDLQKTATSVSTTGFDIPAEDTSEGQVEVKYVYCSWMACALPTTASMMS